MGFLLFTSIFILSEEWPPGDVDLTGWIVQNAKSHLFITNGPFALYLEPKVGPQVQGFVDTPVQMTCRVRWNINGEAVSVAIVKHVEKLAPPPTTCTIEVREANLDEKGVLHFRLVLVNLTDRALSVDWDRDVRVLVLDDEGTRVAGATSIKGDEGVRSWTEIPPRGAVEFRGTKHTFPPDLGWHSGAYRILANYGHSNFSREPCRRGEDFVFPVPKPRDGRYFRMPRDLPPEGGTGRLELEYPDFDTVRDFSEGLAAASKDGMYDYIDRSGAVVIPLRYAEAFSFAEGRAPVRATKDGKWGFIDGEGRLVIKPQFDRVFPFVNGLAVVQAGKSCGYVDKDGRIVIEPGFDSAEPFHEGLAAVKRNSKWGFIDRTGKFVIEPRFEWCGSFSEGLAPIRRYFRYGYIDRTGELVIQPYFSRAGPFANGVAPVTIHDEVRYIDRTGNYVERLKE